MGSKPTPSVGMNIRRGGAKLRALGKAHSPLHVLLWQARETQRAVLGATAAKKTLFSDLASWASSENRALNDVCFNFSELISSLTAEIETNLALAFKLFRKDMSIILEGERRADSSHRKLQDAEGKRIKLRRQVLRFQNRVQETGENVRRTSDFQGLQTQLSEAERAAERAHIEACEAVKEQEAVKLVILKSTMSKLCQSHISFAKQNKIIYENGYEMIQQIPEPAPPGDPLSCIRYNGFESTKRILERTKSQVQLSLSPTSSNCGRSPTRPNFTSTPTSSPLPSTSNNWMSPQLHPSAPAIDTSSDRENLNPFLVNSPSIAVDISPPPPYNTSYFSPHRRNDSHQRSQDLNLSMNHSPVPGNMPTISSYVSNSDHGHRYSNT